MKVSKYPIFKDRLVAQNFTFSVDKNGHEVPLQSDLREEYKALREGIAYTDLSHILIYRLTGNDIVAFLDYTLSGNVGKLREEHILHTLCLNTDGKILTDVYVVNDEDQFLVLADGGEHAKVEAFWDCYKKEYDVHLEKLNVSHGLFSLDGPYAWKPVKSVFGPEILGLTYLGFIRKKEADDDIYILRAGKTGEYGYWILAPQHQLGTIYDKLVNAADEYPKRWYGKSLIDLARLENRFFNLDVEGNFTRNPYELGLFWTIYSDKQMAAGEALASIVNTGIPKSIIGCILENQDVQVGDTIFYKDTAIGIIAAHGFSYTKNSAIGLALLEKDYSYVGLTFYAGAQRIPLRTISTPFLFNKSLSIKIE